MLQGKHILVGISGGIAAYKIPELIRLLRKAGAEVRVATTKNALEFVTELTLQTLSGYKVYSDVFAAINTHSTEHISLPDWADLMIIAPATANVLGKMANGIADDALTTTFCAMRKPVVIAPAMNDKMYRCPATQEAMRHLSGWDNITMLDCAEGELACGTTGRGRMQEPDALLEAIYYALTEKTMVGKRVLITAGPTQEKIDPVRYISNYSTGKMGYALARECYRRGAEVVLVSGPTQCTLPCVEYQGKPTPMLHKVSVGSAQDMYEACLQEFDHCDITILCAAVADFMPETTANQKIKKQPGQDTLCLTLKKTHDIAATLGQRKKANQTIVGFALETHNEEANAIHKMESKGLDMIVLNSLQDAGAGFACDTNKVTIYRKDGHHTAYPLASKAQVAGEIIQCIMHNA
mgnify:FL=1